MKKYIVWKEYYTVNDATLDEQHRQIIECINSLYDAMESVNANEAMKRVLDTLVRYTHEHFDYEEKILREVGYPEWAAQKATHDAMRRKTAALRSNLTLVTARDILVLLKDWWIDHIQGEDKQYAPYMQLTAVR
jgi:hemerythrin